MNKYQIYFLFFISLFFTSCIPAKELIYLQEDGKKNNEQTVDQVNTKPYRLQVADIININIKAIDPEMVKVFNANESSMAAGNEMSNYYNSYVVDDHGDIRFPILGEINVLGSTLEEVRIKIEQRLMNEYFKKEAGVFVIVKLAGFRFTINGEVGQKGSKIIFQDKVNIMEAIANSGDIEVTGDRKDVKVIRRTPNGNQTYSIDLTSSDAVNSPVFNLQPNDYIYVKPLRQKTWGTGKTGLESMTTIITFLSLVTTTFLLLK